MKFHLSICCTAVGAVLVAYIVLPSCAPRPPVPRPQASAREKRPAPWKYARARDALRKILPRLREGMTVEWSKLPSVDAKDDEFECIKRVKLLRRFDAPQRIAGVGKLPPLVTFIAECVGVERSILHLALGPAADRSGRPLRLKVISDVGSAESGSRTPVKAARATWSRARRGVALYTMRVTTAEDAGETHSAVQFFSLPDASPIRLKVVKLQVEGALPNPNEPEEHRLAGWISRKTSPYAVLVVSTRSSMRVETPAPHLSCEYELTFFVLGPKGEVLKKAPEKLSDALEEDPRVKPFVPRAGIFRCGTVD